MDGRPGLLVGKARSVGGDIAISVTLYSFDLRSCRREAAMGRSWSGGETRGIADDEAVLTALTGVAETPWPNTAVGAVGEDLAAGAGTNEFAKAVDNMAGGGEMDRCVASPRLRPFSSFAACAAAEDDGSLGGAVYARRLS